MRLSHCWQQTRIQTFTSTHVTMLLRPWMSVKVSHHASTPYANSELQIRVIHFRPSLQQNPQYTSASTGRISASVWDLSSSTELPEGISAGTVDVVILIFVLSALSPSEWEQAITNVYSVRSFNHAQTFCSILNSVIHLDAKTRRISPCPRLRET